MQALACGLGPGAIAYRLSIGRLHRVHRGVYAVGHPCLSRKGRWMAAVLAGGPAAVLSHRTAAALWGLVPDSGSPVDVTAPARSRRGRPGIRLHQVRALDPRDRCVRDGIPATTLARTLLDLAEAVPPRRLARAIEEAEHRRLFDLRAVDELCRRAPGRRGLKPLREALANARDVAPLTRSELERAFVELCREAGLPRPACNVQVGGREVDALWADARLVVEVDGFASHGTRQAFERDRRRDAELALEGYRVIRLTHRRLRGEPAAVARTLSRLLAGAGQAPTSR